MYLNTPKHCMRNAPVRNQAYISQPVRKNNRVGCWRNLGASWHTQRASETAQDLPGGIQGLERRLGESPALQRLEGTVRPRTAPTRFISFTRRSRPGRFSGLGRTLARTGRPAQHPGLGPGTRADGWPRFEEARGAFRANITLGWAPAEYTPPCNH